MKRILLLSAFLTFIILSCNTAEEKAGNDSAATKNADSNRVFVTRSDSGGKVTAVDSSKLIGSHLSDTAVVLGEWVIFLRPDSLRFESYSKSLKSGIYAADANFGDAVSMAIDTIVGNKEFKGVKAMISNRRYIKVMDCKHGPVTIDRDTVNFGVILSGTDRVLKAEQNVYPGTHYIKVIRKYFGLKK